MVVERSDLVVEVANHILILLALIEFVLDGAHVIEASGEEEIEELDSSPIILSEVFGGIERVDDFPVDEFCLEALEMGTLGELVLFFLLNILLLPLI